MTEKLFLEDAYMRDCEAEIIEINDRGGIVLDKTVFYANSGGQLGDKGVFTIDGQKLEIATTVYGEDRQIVHVPTEGAALPEPGMMVTAALDWAQRHGHMRMHTAMHLLCAILPYPVTGGQIKAGAGRLDFDIPDANIADKQELTERLNELIKGDHAVTQRWISEEALAEKPHLVRTMAVQPPRGEGKVRLVEIDGGTVDRQPCGGTHVASTGEIGEVIVQKIEKKGARNRRVRVAFV